MRIFIGLPVLCCALVWLSVAALAQPNPAPPAADAFPFAARQAQAPSAEPARPEVEELALPIYLKDKDGKLQVVPGFTLEEFDELWELRNQLPAQATRPAASLTAIVVTGTVAQSRADLSIELTIVGAAGSRSPAATGALGPALPPQWVSVPLSLHEARLTEPAKHEGPGQHRLLYDPERGRYVSWLNTSDNSEQRITLKAQVPVESQGNVSRLKLTLPAATQSRFSIRVDRQGIVGELVGGSGGQLDQTTVGGQTEFTIVGARGECQLAWRDTAVLVQRAPAALEAAGMLAVRIDGRSAQINARLTVSSLNQGTFDRFEVRLPPGAVYLSGQAGDYSVQTIESEREERRVLEFSRPEMTADPFTIYLATELPRDNPLADTPLELGGFEVVGALQQYGNLLLEADENWRLLWEHGPNLRQISHEQILDDQPIGPGEPLSMGRPLAAFEYFSQPFAFPVRIVPRTTRVEVEPKYAFTVGPKWINLDAKLKYTIRGTGVFSLDIDLPGWKLDPEGFQPSTAINLDDLVETELTPLRIPLFSPTSGELEITLRATRPIPERADSIEIEIPRPQADFLHRAEVAIIPEDSVELSPRLESMVGLSRQLTSSIRLPTRQQPSLAYRAEQPDARFVAAYQVHPGKVAVNLHSALRLDQNRGNVRQQIDYFIAYEPQDQMIVEMPRSLADSGQVEFTLDSQTLSQSRMPEAELLPDRPARLRISLPAERRIGTGSVVVNYPVSIAPVAPSASKVYTIPLVMPAGVELLRNELQVAVPANWKVQSGSVDWTESTAAPGQQSGRADLYLSADLPQTKLELRVTREDESNLAGTTIDRAWIQTWLTPLERVERMLCRVVTSQDSLALTLPAGANRGRVDVYVDGKPQAVGRRRDRAELVIVLNEPATTAAASGAGERREYLVEFRYFFTRPPVLSGGEPLAAPRFTSDVRVGRTYWQLVLPRDRHLISGPDGYINEYAWTWNGWCFVRRPLLEQANLEEWMRAGRSAPLPLGTNRYLFSSMQGLPPQQFQVIGRWQIVLCASAAALVGGLLLLYVPACRRPPALFVAGLAGLTLAALYPDPAALFLQAASLGLVLALVAIVLRRAVVGTPRPPSLGRRSASSIVRRTSPSSRQRPPLVGSAASTEIKAPAPVEVGSQEPQA